ncbi:hypothetical protein TNCV_697621 [Trichonephila clavipes]|nr:hypothetical protein TNCV_697621 [Trichonephila clavipes]
MSSFQMNSDYVCSIRMTIYVCGGSEEIAHRLLAFDIGIGALHLLLTGWATIRYTTHTSRDWINGNLNADWYFSDILSPVVVPYLQSLPNTIFQQGDARPHIVCHVLTFFDALNI